MMIRPFRLALEFDNREMQTELFHVILWHFDCLAAAAYSGNPPYVTMIESLTGSCVLSITFAC